MEIIYIFIIFNTFVRIGLNENVFHCFLFYSELPTIPKSAHAYFAGQKFGW